MRFLSEQKDLIRELFRHLPRPEPHISVDFHTVRTAILKQQTPLKVLCFHYQPLYSSLIYQKKRENERIHDRAEARERILYILYILV